MYFKIFQIVIDLLLNLRPVIGHWFTNILRKFVETSCNTDYFSSLFLIEYCIFYQKTYKL